MDIHAVIILTGCASGIAFALGYACRGYVHHYSSGRPEQRDLDAQAEYDNLRRIFNGNGDNL